MSPALPGALILAIGVPNISEPPPVGPVLGATEQGPDDKVELPEGSRQFPLGVGHQGHLRSVHEQDEPRDEGAHL